MAKRYPKIMATIRIVGTAFVLSVLQNLKIRFFMGRTLQNPNFDDRRIAKRRKDRPAYNGYSLNHRLALRLFHQNM
jgi:hypothetical protein